MTAIGDLEGTNLSGGEGNDRFHVRDGEKDRSMRRRQPRPRDRRSVRPSGSRLRAREIRTITYLDQVEDTEKPDGNALGGRERGHNP